MATTTAAPAGAAPTKASRKKRAKPTVAPAGVPTPAPTPAPGLAPAKTGSWKRIAAYTLALLVVLGFIYGIMNMAVKSEQAARQVEAFAASPTTPSAQESTTTRANEQPTARLSFKSEIRLETEISLDGSWSYIQGKAQFQGSDPP